jgi:hypothetical protein
MNNKSKNLQNIMQNIYCLLILSIVLCVIHQISIQQLKVAIASQNFEVVQKQISLNFWLMIFIVIVTTILFFKVINRYSSKICAMFFMIEFIVVFVVIFSAKMYANIMINFDEIAKHIPFIQIPMLIHFSVQILFFIYLSNQR